MSTITKRNTEIAKRLMPITSSVNGHKGDPSKPGAPARGEYSRADLEKLGFAVERTVVLPFFHRDDFGSPKALADGFARVIKEWQAAIDLWTEARKGDKPDAPSKVLVTNAEGKEAELANPADILPASGKRELPDGTQVPYTLADAIFDALVSGGSLAFQAEHGRTMRDKIKSALGTPKGKSVGRGNRADAGF